MGARSPATRGRARPTTLRLMGTRTIVTFHPDVECDVCGRRLLRGEQSDVFITGGQRRMVCELCTTRATHEGWLRESDGHAKSARAARPQRGRSLLGRLRPRGVAGAGGSSRSAQGTARGGGSRGGLYDFLDSSSPELGGEGVGEQAGHELAYSDQGQEEQSRGVPERSGGERGQAAYDGAHGSSTSSGATVRRQAAEQPNPTTGELKAARALEVFNAGEQPRRMAGVARSLGVPAVRVAPVAESGGVVAIVVAWELCWYRYEVDLGDEAAGVRLVGQGMELEELEAAERLPNAAADERGMLTLLD